MIMDYWIHKAAFVSLLTLVFGFSPATDNVAHASSSDLIGFYDCNTGTKPEVIPTHNYEMYLDGESLTVRSGSSCVGNVIIPEGVVSIDQEAFKNSSISTIILPRSLKVIENKAFRNSSLTQISIPDGVESIGDEAFYSNDLLETLNLGSNVKSIGAYAFAVTKIVNLILPQVLETIRTNAFSSTSLESIFIPQSVRTIDGEAFAYNSHLLTLSITDSITTLANSAFNSSNMAFVDTSYCGSLYLDFESNFFGSTFTCRSPSSISVSITSSNSERSITFNVGKNINHGGAPIAKYILENDVGEVLQTIDYSSDPVFHLSDQPTGKNLKFRVKAENSSGLFAYSNYTTGITFGAFAEENEESRRQAEVKRQQEVLKSREISLNKLKSGETLSLEDFNKSDLLGVTMENYARIQNRVNKTVDKVSLDFKDIEKAVKYVGTVDAICLKGEASLIIRAQNLVEIGLIPEESKHRTQIWYLVKNSPAVMRQDENSLIALIGQIQVGIDNRKTRIEELKRRSAARKSNL